MCGFVLMPDGVHGSDKIHTLVALYTALLSNRRHTHTHTKGQDAIRKSIMCGQKSKFKP